MVGVGVPRQAPARVHVAIVGPQIHTNRNGHARVSDDFCPGACKRECHLRCWRRFRGRTGRARWSWGSSGAGFTGGSSGAGGANRATFTFGTSFPRFAFAAVFTVVSVLTGRASGTDRAEPTCRAYRAYRAKRADRPLDSWCTYGA